MTSTKLDELDKALQSLNGLHDNSSKRIEICKYIQEKGFIAVFAFGSLLWNSLSYVGETISGCTLHGYRKGFFCEDFVYRGTMKFKGLTLGLKEDRDWYVKGALLVSSADQVIPFLEDFVKREAPVSSNGTVMDIYRYDFVEIIMPDGMSSQYALTCVVNTNSSFYVKPPLTSEEQAQKMATAYGQNGTNLQYLKLVVDKYSELKLSDACTDEIEDLYQKVIVCREGLSKNALEWLKTYDGLQTLLERQEAVNAFDAIEFQASPGPHLHRLLRLETNHQQSLQGPSI